MLTYLHPEAVKKFLGANGLERVKITLPFLTKLGRAFQKMPYENLTKIIRSHSISDPEARIRLPELLYEEFLRFGTGGTCFSMTYFLQTILRACGFETYPVMADRPLAPDTHCASVTILNQQKYFLDPGFMIDRPLLLTQIPKRYRLRHNDIIIGAKGAIPIPPHQLKHFQGLYEKGLDLYKCIGLTPLYTIATSMRGKTDIRYFLKDEAVPPERFLKLWLDSFNWPTLRNISITVATDKGYIYARNNFLRVTTRKMRRQERIKKGLDLTLGKTFNINTRVIHDAFERQGGQVWTRDKLKMLLSK